MENVKYQVFISSTFNDLKNERKKALEVLLMADCIPAGMEAFVATDLEQFEVIKKVIDYCDYYALIIGKRYGSISKETGVSYTEMEYDYAVSQNIPVLVFALDESVELSEDKVDNEPEKIKKLAEFRKKAMTNRMATVWHTVDELTGHLAISIMKAKSEIKRPGWQRASSYDEASLRRDIMELQEKNEQLHKSLNEKQEIIDSLTKQTDLAFEDCLIHIDCHYFKHNSRDVPTDRVNISKDIPLIDLFKVISLEMLNISITEYGIEKIVKLKFFEDENIAFNDSQIIKYILNQLLALKLVHPYPSKNNLILFWGLTEKGKNIRNSLVLIRK